MIFLSSADILLCDMYRGYMCIYHHIQAHRESIIVVVDNSGYGTQRPMRDGPFNDIAPLAAERLVDVFGVGQGWLAETEDELAQALTEAFASDGLAIVHAKVPQGSISPALKRLTDALAKRV